MTPRKPLDDVRTPPARTPSVAVLRQLGAAPEQITAFEALASSEDVALQAGRMIAQLGPELVIDVGDQMLHARASGVLRREANEAAALPVVGDYVAVVPGTGDGHGRVERVLPRRSLLQRRAAGSDTDVQAIAANVDVVFAVAALDQNVSVRRLERAVLLARQAPALPVVVLTKADLCDDVPARVEALQHALPGVQVIVIGAADEHGLDELRVCLPERLSGVLIGLSGAGKSTLTNRLLASEQMAVGAVRSTDARGRHTTTHREIVATGWGAFLIDGPGVRELGIVEDAALDSAFEDIASLAQACRFADCAHTTEPHCAVHEALDNGTLSKERFGAYQKLLREAAFTQAQSSPTERRARNDRHRALTSAAWEASRRKR